MVCAFIIGITLYFLVLILGVIGTIGIYILFGIMIFKMIDCLFNKLSGRW